MSPPLQHTLQQAIAVVKWKLDWRRRMYVFLFSLSDFPSPLNLTMDLIRIWDLRLLINTALHCSNEPCIHHSTSLFSQQHQFKQGIKSVRIRKYSAPLNSWVVMPGLQFVMTMKGFVDKVYSFLIIAVTASTHNAALTIAPGRHHCMGLKWNIQIWLWRQFSLKYRGFI